MDNTVGIVGSPSGTAEIAVDILEGSEGGSLLGQLVALPHQVEDGHAIAIGTVSEIVTHNRWHEDQNMRGVLKQHGALPHLSGVGDVRTAAVRVQAAYRCEFPDPRKGSEPTEIGAALPMSPATGSSVIRVTDDYLGGLLRRHKDKMVFLGHAYNMDEVRLPLTIRHFGSVKAGGAGEAYHSGIFGMTGSGKSVFAAYVIAAHLRHPDLAILVMDPQGQFTRGEDIPVSLEDWATQHNREVKRYSISNNLQLPKNATLLMDILRTTNFFRDILAIKGSANQEIAADVFARSIQQNWNNAPADDVLRNLLEAVVGNDLDMKRIYAGKPQRDQLAGTINSILVGDLEHASTRFRPFHLLFANNAGRTPLARILGGMLDPERKSSPCVILDLSPGQNELLTAAVQALLLRVICETLSWSAERAYRQGKTLNTLVVFDEAHRFAANDPEGDEAKALSDKLSDYVLTTRKYGLGWMFITQEAGALRRSIYNQLRFRAFGYGLTSGSELDRIRQTIGDTAAVELYRSFVDPAAVSPRRYPFMLQGPISPLSFAGTPLFLSVYTDFEKFKVDNGYSS